jgi:hypothetical protein
LPWGLEIETNSGRGGVNIVLLRRLAAKLPRLPVTLRSYQGPVERS